ncbi:hypothetical protein OHT57_17255 [Streptomyces sp. NBC_00285]|uniref:hypothetical protein n=1 Tax=Streptomyces sp. NBC_00285 TaxID=2975700 RepID=UPI002E2DE693|nr:hypothetical protein [Streptomyces sp. NBC_00285]
MRTWPARRWAVATAVTVLAALVIGVPTGVVPTPVYTRMTPVLWWNYPVWLVSSALEGLLVATYVRIGAAEAPETAPRERPRTTRAIGAGLLSAFAVGCPICNKIVVLAIGVSGALSYFAPVQPVLALASVALLVHALVRRLRTANVCRVPS